MPNVIHFTIFPVQRGNNRAISLSGNESINRRNQHIDITFHIVRYVVGRKEVPLNYKPTMEMMAEIMTKALGKRQHRMCVTGMGLVQGTPRVYDQGGVFLIYHTMEDVIGVGLVLVQVYKCTPL